MHLGCIWKHWSRDFEKSHRLSKLRAPHQSWFYHASLCAAERFTASNVALSRKLCALPSSHPASHRNKPWISERWLASSCQGDTALCQRLRSLRFHCVCIALLLDAQPLQLELWFEWRTGWIWLKDSGSAHRPCLRDWYLKASALQLRHALDISRWQGSILHLWVSWRCFTEAMPSLPRPMSLQTPIDIQLGLDLFRFWRLGPQLRPRDRHASKIIKALLAGTQVKAGNFLPGIRRGTLSSCLQSQEGSCLMFGWFAASWKVTELIGSGSYGSVCEAVDDHKGERRPFDLDWREKLVLRYW